MRSFAVLGSDVGWEAKPRWGPTLAGKQNRGAREQDGFLPGVERSLVSPEGWFGGWPTGGQIRKPCLRLHATERLGLDTIT